jgi:hypothetical protein
MNGIINPMYEICYLQYKCYMMFYDHTYADLCGDFHDAEKKVSCHYHKLTVGMTLLSVVI